MPTLSETMLMLSRKLQGLPIEEPKPIDKYDYSNPNSLPLLPWQPGGSEYVSYEDILKSKEAAKRFDRDCIRPIYNPSLFSALPFEEVAKLVDKRVKITNLKYVYNYCLESHAKSFDFTFIVSCNYHTLNGKKINPNTFRKLLKILEKAKVIEKLSNGDNQWRYDEGERMHMASVYRWVTASERAYTLNDECEAPTALVEANNTITEAEVEEEATVEVKQIG